MMRNKVCLCNHIIALTTALMFGIPMLITPQALVDQQGKAKGYSKEWKQEKEYCKTDREERRCYKEERDFRKHRLLESHKNEVLHLWI